MKPLTLEAYKLLYFLTGSRVFSYYVATAIVASLNVIVLSGLVILLDGVLPTKMLARFFTFPYSIGVGAVLFFVNIKVVPISFMEVANHVSGRYIKLTIYTLVAALLMAYKILLN